MSESKYKITAAPLREQCSNPALREMLADYLIESLADPEAEEVEDHLLYCRLCRGDYLKIVNLQSAMRHARAASAGSEKTVTDYREMAGKGDYEE